MEYRGSVLERKSNLLNIFGGIKVAPSVPGKVFDDGREKHYWLQSRDSYLNGVKKKV